MNIKLPELSLVVLIGASGSGKSTFARRHFKETEILSSDFCRALVRDDENDQSATADAFEILHHIASLRLRAGKLTVIDATNVQPEARKSLVAVAREQDVLPVAIVLDLPERLCHERNKAREDRSFGPHVIRQQRAQLNRSFRLLEREGFRHISRLRSEEEVAAASIERVRLWNDRKEVDGPFDIIGDIHGCRHELDELLSKLGYTADAQGEAWRHPEGRQVVFVGDLVDRGPDSPGVLRRAMAMCEAGSAHCVPGNHDEKLLRKLRGRDVRIAHGLERTLEQLEKEPEEFREKVRDFLGGLVSHLVFDDGKLVVAHAGLREEYQGRTSGRVKAFCLYGETSGEIDDYGIPVRHDWAAEYRGSAAVVYGHTPTVEATWVNRTLCVDTGCVFGGKLTALRYPEREIVDVEAEEIYWEPARPLVAPVPTQARSHHDLLDIEDVAGKRIIETRHHHAVTVREQNQAAALEVMSRFAVDPRWLIYLPPTMSPSETCEEGEFLEHPKEAFAYFRKREVPTVICQEKHMGSRAVVVLCRDEAEATRRFHVDDGSRGVIYTRTGRPFFRDPETERLCLDRIRVTLDEAGFWEEFATGWVCLDAELLPWSAKAEDLLRTQYAGVGAAAMASLGRAQEEMAKAIARGAGDAEIQAAYSERLAMSQHYVEAYRRYCWRVDDVSDLKIAPFHLLATEGRVHIDRDHLWHMETLGRLCDHGGGFLHRTAHRLVDPADEGSVGEGIAWWEEMTGRGGEGMVIKPLEWISRSKKGLTQPALKCRGREYLRIIYGPEYTAPTNLERLRRRGLAGKRSLALREYALGLEALHRFVENEPLYRTHECVFAVLALESEPLDPRL